jgi:hypothetical protein
LTKGSEWQQIDREIKKIQTEFESEIKKSQEDNYLDDLQLSEHEDIEVEVDEEDNFDKMDFNARLGLSKEERRRFWMLSD